MSVLPERTQPERPSQSVQTASRDRVRALANWDPAYPEEQIDYYQEYIHRHAPIHTGWLGLPRDVSREGKNTLEATGVGVIRREDAGTAEQVVAPMNDGSIAIWDIKASETRPGDPRGMLLGRSAMGLLSGRASETERAKAMTESKTIMTETGAVECVSIDSARKKGFFAVQDVLHEVDLHTLQLVSSESFPFPITALSSAEDSTAVTVGTNWTLHVHDPRNKSKASDNSSHRLELIGGPTASHATLPQPGPLSVLHHPGYSHDDHSIWVAGRFTPLLNYDRRFFPRLRGTIHSGARIASLALLPRPYVPRSLDLLQNPSVSIADLHTAKSQIGSTILAAGTYKGKGSLELYGLSPPSVPGRQIATSGSYQNRQTASATKLLSVAAHGASIVFSDGDGNLKWVERDGFSAIRSYNINAAPEEVSFNQAQSLAQDASAYGIFSSSASEMPGQGDLVQKIIPTSTTSQAASPSTPSAGSLGQSDLVLWTGDGRLGILGFGHESPYTQAAAELESKAESAEERAREDAEREYAGRLRRALERQADEVRFVRGLGLAAGFGME